MIKIIAILSLLLTLVSGYSYIQHLKIKAKDVEISTQLDVISNLEKDIKDKKERLEIERNMSSIVITDTRLSDDSFNNLTKKLNKIDCSSQKEVKSNETSKVSTPVNISEYYDILHTAYSLQNKN